MEVHDYADHLTEEQADIVAFWQRDPNVTRNGGHELLEGNAATRWMLIASRATLQRELSLAEAADLYADLGVALGDVGVSVWRAKYETFLLSPETYIHDYVDERWTPVVPTTNAPTYPAADPALSAAAAEVLTAHLGIVHFQRQLWHHRWRKRAATVYDLRGRGLRARNVQPLCGPDAARRRRSGDAPRRMCGPSCNESTVGAI